jgi:metal-responsive CopG/Arc/MetJ family transcriptional regulator
MKIKTSITLESDLVGAIDRQVAAHGSRSEFLELAARRLLARLAKETQEERDREAEDVLDYQVGV